MACKFGPNKAKVGVKQALVSHLGTVYDGEGRKLTPVFRDTYQIARIVNNAILGDT